MQLSPWMNYYIFWNRLYEDHIWWTALLLDQVWASCGPRGGRNNNKCGLMKFVNIVRPKVLIFDNVNLYRPYWVSVLMKFGWLYNAQRRSPFGENRRRHDHARRHRWHYINALFSEAAWHFKIQIYRMSSTRFYLRFVYSFSVILTAYSIYASWSSSCRVVFFLRYVPNI